jgi:Kef-type K+ transport system membrane component KefB
MLAMIPFIGWRMYARIRRMIGRQKSSPTRQWLTICLFPVIAVLIGSVSAAQPYAITALLAGIAIGAGLGVLGHRLTKFEQTEEGLFYTPNAHLGVALSVLLFARILYRFLFSGLISGNGVPSNAAPSPLTLALFGMLAGYYVAYAIGLVLWRRSIERSTATDQAK